MQADFLRSTQRASRVNNPLERNTRRRDLGFGSSSGAKSTRRN